MLWGQRGCSVNQRCRHDILVPRKVLTIDDIEPPSDRCFHAGAEDDSDAGAEGSRGTEWLHVHFRRYGVAYVNQGEECAVLRLF